MTILSPINFKKWIDENRHLLKPPVGNRVVWQDTEFIVMVVGGPNQRNDYHVNEGEEFFYQLEGDMTLKIIKEGKPVDIAINEGEIFLLPPNTPHSPQRPVNTVGLVIEKRRLPEDIDAFQWYCPKCWQMLYEEKFHLTDIVNQFQAIFERFYKDETNTTCKQCGTRIGSPDAKN